MSKKIAGIYETKQQAWEAIEAFRGVDSALENPKLVGLYKELADAIEADLVQEGNPIPEFKLWIITGGNLANLQDQVSKGKIKQSSYDALALVLDKYDDLSGYRSPASVFALIAQVIDELKKEEIEVEAVNFVSDRLNSAAINHYNAVENFLKD